MKSIRRLIALTALCLCALGSIGAAQAAAGPILNLDVHHNETNFAPGETGEYWFDVWNVGDTATTGTITLTINLPNGVTREEIDDSDWGILSWSCPGGVGDTTIVCTTTSSIPRHNLDRGRVLRVAVSPGASGTRFLVAKLEGGGSPPAPASQRCAVGAAACEVEPTQFDATDAGFGILAPSFAPDFYEVDEMSTVRSSGAHPPILSVPFAFNTTHVPNVQFPQADITVPEKARNLIVNLPPGFLGNPTAVGECSQANFIAAACPGSTQVGRIDYTTFPIGNQEFNRASVGVFNLSHPLGSVTDLAFIVTGNPVHIRATLDPANQYAIRTEVRNINTTVGVFSQRFTVWGVPADKSHDSERCSSWAFTGGAGNQADTSRECSIDVERKPFLTVPSECGKEHQVRIHSYDSWEDGGDYGPDIVYTQPGETTDCDKPRFEPSVELNPTGREAATPTGLDVSIQIPQNENPNALATPPVKSTVVRFPAGMTVNPAFADGLAGCSLAQIGLGTNEAVACPDNSRIGEVHLSTPLLPRALEGSMYLAAQGQNPFGSTFAIYMAIHDTEDRGVLVKIPGRIDLHPNTGQMTTTFDELPQFPFDDFTLSFRSGQRAPLVNPPTCGTHTIEVAITSYAQPGAVVDASSAYQVREGPGGSPCVAGAAGRPFDPQMAAGVLNPVAGAHSPFIFRLTRTDAEQDISRVTTKLPLGLTAKLAGVQTCSEAAIAAISTAEGTGAAESANPSCPPGSQVGVLNAGVGAGTSPNYFLGRAFLAGPYKGSPLSFVTVVPAIAGPYDLGSVVVRIAANIDPRTSEVTATSDAFPPIVQGVLVRVRDVRLNMNRDQFTLNPTSCEPMAVQASIFSDLGALATPSSRFQVGECGSLGFKPKLYLKLRGGTKRGAHPQLTANLYPRTGDANIRSLSVAFPRSEFLENAHIRTICTRADFAASACPAGAIYGTSTAYTPILGYPLQANVYLRSSSNLLPDVVPDFRGPPSQPIRFESAGRVDSIKGGIRNTFDFIPDAPISRVLFRLQGGNKGLLVNSRDICARTYRAKVVFTAHNGARHVTRPKMQAVACKKAKKRVAKRRAHKRSKRSALARSARVR